MPIRSLAQKSVVATRREKEKDPALALADGMKFLLRFGDDRSAGFRSGSAGCPRLMEWRGFILMSVDEVFRFRTSPMETLPPKPGNYHSLDSQP